MGGAEPIVDTVINTTTNYFIIIATSTIIITTITIAVYCVLVCCISGVMSLPARSLCAGSLPWGKGKGAGPRGRCPGERARVLGQACCDVATQPYMLHATCKLELQHTSLSTHTSSNTKHRASLHMEPV